MGRKTKEWAKSRAKLEVIYQEKGITTCELRLPGCWYNNALYFAHKEKRIDASHTFKETILACNPCHQQIEYDRELTERMFKKLRS